MIDRTELERIKAVLIEIVESTETPLRDRMRAAELLLQYCAYEEAAVWNM